MTILNTIDNLTASIERPLNAVYLGHLEQKAFLAANAIMGFQITLDNIRSANLVYRGLTVIPVDLPSYMAVASVYTAK